MSLDQIRTRIADLADRLSNSLATDLAFAADFKAILDLIRPAGYEVWVDVEELESGEQVAVYRPNSSSDRSDEPSEKKNLSEHDWAVKCTVRAWRDPRPAVRATEMDLIFRGLGNLIYKHWGERDAMSLLPRLQDPAIPPRLIRLVEAAAAQSNQLSVVYVDLDNFKAVNSEVTDTGGNVVLKEFTRRFRNAFADIGVPARTFSGDEYSAFLFHDDAGEVLKRIETFRARMESESLPVINRPNTCSIGVAIYSDYPLGLQNDIDSLLNDARESASRAKKAGKNRIRLAAQPVETPIHLTLSTVDLVEAALKARLDLQNEQTDCYSTVFVNVIANLLASRIAEADIESASNIIAKIVDSFGVTLANDPAEFEGSSVLLSSCIAAREWAAIVARGFLRATFATGRPLSFQDSLSFALESDGESSALLCLNVLAQDGRSRSFQLARNVASPMKTLPVQIGRPWYPAEIAATGAAKRYMPPNTGAGRELARSPAMLSPCMLLPIGDQAISLAKTLSNLVADIVEIDDRPVLGGGLPDFWQSNLARIIRSCLRNLNIQSVIGIGVAENASNTFARLHMSREEWDNSLYQLQRALTISAPHLQAFRARNLEVICVEVNSDGVLSAIMNAHLTISDLETNSNFIDLDAASKGRRLPPALPAETNRLLLFDGLRTRTLAEAYPQALQLLRNSEAPAQTEPTQRQFRELPCFKLVLTSPLQDIVPDYWLPEQNSLRQYYDRNFTQGTGLFATQIFKNVEGERSVYDYAFQMCIDALQNARPTRRVTLPVIPLPDRFGLPIGWFAIQIMPRFRDERWHLDFQWIWRTVEALVGFPFSAYGSIVWSREFFESIRSELGRRGIAVGVEFGELSYIALSFHMFLDVGDREIARAIVQEASR